MTLSELIKIIAKHHNISPESMKSDGRKPNVCRARQHFYVFAVERFKHSYKATGRFLNKDHTTVIHGVNRAKHNEQFYKIAEELERIKDEERKKTSAEITQGVMNQYEFPMDFSKDNLTLDAFDRVVR